MLDILFTCIVFTFFALPSIAKPFDLDTLKIINSTKDVDTVFPEAPGTNSTDALEYHFAGCFQQSPPNEPQLSRTNFIDCSHAQEQIAAHDHQRPIHFRRNPNSAFVLPTFFTYRTCVIFLDMVSADAEDFFFVAEIGAAAIDTARRCTSVKRALGGKAMAGPKGLMEVEVSGRPWPWAHEGLNTILLDADDAVA